MAGFVVMHISQEDYDMRIRNKTIDEVFDFLKTQRDKKSMKANFDDLEIRKYKEQLKGNEFFYFNSPVVRVDEKSYNKAIDEFVDKALYVLGAEDWEIWAKEAIKEIAEQMKGEQI